MNETMTLEQVDEVVSDTVITNLQNDFLFSNDNWYKENPDKILGVAYQTSGRFGQVTKYKGSIDSLQLIDVDENFVGAEKSINDPLASVSSDINVSAIIQQNEVQETILSAIEVSKIDIEKAKRKPKKVVEEDAVFTPIEELNSFQQTFQNLNNEISLEEVEAYTWYKTNIGKPLSKYYVKLFKPEMFEGETPEQLRETYNYTVSDEVVTQWVINGLLYYYNGQLLPKFEYCSGNMYDKKLKLQSEREIIVSKYGEQVFENHELALKYAFDIVYKKRLMVGGENSLVVLANSKFAKNFMVETIEDLEEGKQFKISKVTAASNKDYGRPDFIKDLKTYSDWKKDTFDQLNLADAFSYWLLRKKPELKESISHLDVYKYYVEGSPIRIPHDKDNPADVKRAETQKEKLKSATQKEGERLFSEFLETQLVASDKVRLETQWNMDFNNYLPVDLNKVPVAFTMAKYVYGKEEIVRQEKRDVVAFAMSNGTGVLSYDVGVGKANLLTSNILTPTGWKKMADIKVGDDVIGKNGFATKVIGVFPQGKRQSYRVRFSDGSFTEVTDEHLWNVQTINYRAKYKEKWDVVRTMDIKDSLYNYRGDYQYSIPMVEPVHFDKQNVPIHPYVLGVLIGDGYLSENSVTFSNTENDIIQKIKMLLPDSVDLKAKNKIDWRISKKQDKNKNNILEAIRNLGLNGKKSNQKFIPDVYKFNTPEVRLEVLRGLIDTDGFIHVAKGGGGCTVIYTTVSQKLAEDVKFMVQSFGGTVSIKTKKPLYTYNGEKKQGQLAYNVSIRLPHYILPVTTTKHLSKFKPKSKYNPVRYIESIEDIGMQEAQCIKVSAADELYVCDDFIVTHNTPSAIFTLSAFMDAGYCKRPLIVVPNQVYKQFISELKAFAPHIPINEGYNFSKEYIENFKNANGQITNVQDGTITIVTYDGFENIGFSEETSNDLVKGLYDILNQGGEDLKPSAKKTASFFERIETIVGRGLRGGMYNIEDFGFDFMCYDEAHKMKKVFTSVKGESEEDEKTGKVSRGKNPYVISSGSPSSIALKGFMINYYILQKNGYKNVLLLTATPFTNSPLEIFSVLSMVAYEQLKETSLNNIKNFFDTYVKTSTELVINSKLKPQYKQVILGFNNLISLQSLIRRYILYKTGEDVNIVRPKKYVLPYLKEIENGIVVSVPEERKVETYIGMTPAQKAMMDDIIEYVETGSALGRSNEYSESELEPDEDESQEVSGDAVDIDEDSLSDNEKLGVRTIKGLSYSRNLALSPHLYEFSGLGKPNYKTYVESSPKLSYVMNCVKSVREYCISNDQPIAGQVIYMDRGIEYFGLLKEYLINEVGYKEHEIGIIKSGLPKNTTRSKEYVKNLFNGEIYNEKSKSFEIVDDSLRIKVVIGSSTIKEGMNLQKYGAILYNCFIDWNPTDIQQLEGRIYRQKNTYDAVRIVNPLVVDSADIFLFQKLQEKTSRLNTIWSTDGKANVLNTNEFNPEELKYALIKDPKVIAELRIIEEKSKIESDILGINRQIDIVDRVRHSAYTIKSYFDKVLSSISDYRDFNQTDDRLDDAIRLVQIVNDLDKKQTDREGKIIIPAWQKKYAKEEDLKKASSIDVAYSKPYYFSDFAVAARDLRKYTNEFIKQYNIDFDINNYDTSLDFFKKDLEAKIADLEDRKKFLSSDENKKLLIEQAIEEKERQKINYKTIPQLVSDFGKLNFLLDKKVIYNPKELPKFTSCPPLEADGKTPAISDEALQYLNSCLEKEPQTKDLYFDEKTGYTPERQKVHKKIVDEIFENVKCIKSGNQPIAVFTGGSPASGKSTFLKKHASYILSDDIFHLDADEIRSKLPEYKGWNANATHTETTDIVNSILDRLGSESCRYDFVYDGTMNKAKKYFSIINKVKSLGYKTYIIFMDISYPEAKKRVLQRYQNSGRYVPMEVVDDFFTKTGDKSKGEISLEELKDVVDGYIVADGITGKIKEEGGEGLPEKRDSKVYGTPLKQVTTSKSEKPSKTDIVATINALKFLSDAGNKDAEATIKSLKFLI